MGTLLTRSVRFGATLNKSTVYAGKLNSGFEFVDVPNRVLRADIINNDDADVIFNLDGSTDNISFTNRATVTVKARSQATLSGALRGSADVYFRWTVQAQATTSAGPNGTTITVNTSDGVIEIFEESSHLIR